jgi:PAS domain S-box-containing protein
MSQSLRLLIVEDSEDDAFLIQHTLRQGGYAVTAEVVQTEPAMRAALENQKWDIITSDHSMPRFNARDSLALAKRLCPDVPFIILSGEIDLNLAVSLMRGGAEDYIQKRELARLVPAVERELRELALHRERQQVDRALIQSDERLREVLENSLNVAYKRNIQTQSYDYLSPVTTRVTGYTPDELMSLSQETLLSWIHPDDIGEYTRLVNEGVSYAAGTEAQVEFRFRHKDGHYLWLRDSFIVIPDVHGKPLSRIGSLSDITERKRSDAEREALLEIMQGLVVTKDLHEILSLVHHSVAKVVFAENFFVVFYNKLTGLFEEVYSVDQYDLPAPPSRLEKSITAYTLRTGKPIIMTQALFNQLEAQGEVEMVGTNSASWLGAPLITPDGTIGVIAIQDYEIAD